jgi:alpha-glucoside transport system substrate-binding protein
VEEIARATVLPGAASFPLAGVGGAPILERLPRLPGEVVRILGPETGANAAGFEAAFAPFEAATGIDVVYEGTPDDTKVLEERVAAGTPPDLTVVAQPGRLVDLAAAGVVRPVPDSIAGLVAADYDRFWTDLVDFRGRTYAVPNVASVKSLVWYSPQRFASLGYPVPTTWAELEALTARVRADGLVPWCIGISSGEASGWPFTDWLEDVILRLWGPEVYDGWVTNEVRFDDPRIREAVELVGRIWFTEGNVAGGRSAIVRTGFADAGLPLLGGECLMHRQASFYASELAAAGAVLGAQGDVNVFYLPTIDGRFGQVVLGSGNVIAALTDRPAAYAALAYVASPEYANTRIVAGTGGFWSANKRQTPGLHRNEVDARIAQILLTANPFRFDGSDLMPTGVGSDEFWRASTAYVNGSLTTDDFLDRVQAAWPR